MVNTGFTVNQILIIRKYIFFMKVLNPAELKGAALQTSSSKLFRPVTMTFLATWKSMAISMGVRSAQHVLTAARKPNQMMAL